MRRVSLFFLLLLTAGGCANIVPPSGGERDTKAPVLLRAIPADSGLNVRTTKIELRFDEYITLQDPSAIQISPLLPFPVRIAAGLRTVTISLPDSLLKDATTYTLTFGRGIQDLHEGNPFTGYTYRFSTGPYFDSLELRGNVFNAETGEADTGSRILLYEDSPRGDSAVTNGPPLYTTTTDATGSYTLKGLPRRTFRIYAHRESNGNLTYDAADESIAFLTQTVTPSDTGLSLPPLRIFKSAAADTAGGDAVTPGKRAARNGLGAQAAAPARGSGYTVLADTAANARSQELSAPLTIAFPVPVKTLNTGRIFLSRDSAGITTEAFFRAGTDTADLRRLSLNVAWVADAQYTLRLQKGFATDSAGNDYFPGKYAFRTKREEDYATLRIDVPGRFYGSGFVLQVRNAAGRDTLFSRAITDSTVIARRVTPGAYSAIIIEDNNRNGHWDTGDLLAGRQPELVFPHAALINLKAGWEVQVDFKPPGNNKNPGKVNRISGR